MLVRVYRKRDGEFAGQFHVSISPNVVIHEVGGSNPVSSTNTFRELRPSKSLHILRLSPNCNRRLPDGASRFWLTPFGLCAAHP